MHLDKENGVDTILLEPRKGSLKVQITTQQQLQPKTLTHLPNRPKVDLAFSELKYIVRQGKSEYSTILLHLRVISFQQSHVLSSSHVQTYYYVSI